MKRLLNGIGLMNQNAWSDFIKIIGIVLHQEK